MILPMAWIGFCIATGMFAHVRRNRNGIAWFFISLVLSPLVGFVLLLILLPLEPVSFEHYESFAVKRSIPFDRLETSLSERFMRWMIFFVITVLLIGTVIASKAQQQTPTQQVIRDASGHVVITSTSSGNQTTYRDSGGRTVGTSTIDDIGNTILRDASGRTVGTVNGRK